MPLFFVLFTRTREFAENGVEALQTDKFPMPSVTVWKAVAEVLTKGLHNLAPSAIWAVGVAVLVGLAMEAARTITKGKFPLSPVGLGLAFVINFQSSFAMFLGALVMWLLTRRAHGEGARPHFWSENHEPICAGVIAGAALMGIADAIVAAFIL